MCNSLVLLKSRADVLTFTPDFESLLLPLLAVRVAGGSSDEQKEKC
jgi:hypothetical protein